MMFTEEIKHLREKLQMPQRQLAAALEIDTATYCKIEKGERRIRREQVILIAKVLQIDANELLSLWLADQVVEVIENDKILANNVLNIARKIIKI